MASYNINKPGPLLDSNVQALLNKRGRELLGLVLLFMAATFALILGSYHPADPGWMAASDAPVRNSLGRVGAALAGPLMVILGMSSWGLVVLFLGWGLRLVTGRGHNKGLSRGIFAPLGLAVGAVWCATFVPMAGWDMPYGMGGVFGDTILGAVVNALPLSPAGGVTFMSVFMFAVTLAVGAFVLGVTWPELWRFGQFLVAGVILTYAGIFALLRGGVVSTVKTAQTARVTARDMAARRAQLQAERAEAMYHPPAPEPEMYPEYAPPPPLPARSRATPVIRATPVTPPPPLFEDDEPEYPYAEPPLAKAPVAQAAPAQPVPGLLSKLRNLSARPVMPQPELVEHPVAHEDIDVPADRITARIVDAVRHRKPSKPVRVFDPSVRPVTEPPLRAPVESQVRAVEPVLRAPVAAPVAPALSVRAEVSGPSFGPVPMPDWMRVAAPPVAPALVPQQIAPEPEEPGYAPPPVIATRRVVTTAQGRPQPSRRAQEEAQPRFAFDPSRPQFELPPLTLLETASSVQRFTQSDEALEENARMLENVLDDYGVRGEIVSVRPGPVVTQYELEPAPGLKASRVIGLADDIARSMSALSARVSTVPGRSIIGIELPNAHREKVVLREILSTRDFGDTNMRLPLALGKAIDGEPVVANLAKMPHLLIAGTTGSGKSVAINTMILSLLYRLTPEECRMIMIDPKMLELSVYDGIPHLLSPVVTDPKKAVVALKWVVAEMEDRYRKMSKMGVRNIDGYNGRVREALCAGEKFKRTIQTGFDDETGDPVFETEEFAPELLPYIVVIVDEMADLMMVAGKEIEACIQRLAQMARASGIHLIMATQRPSVDVITGTIKANFPTRISFQVTSKIDSRTILGEQGAEQLLGQGDMLYMAGGSRIVRVHGPFVSDEEVEEVVTHLKSFGPPDYKSGVIEDRDGERDAEIDAVLGLGGNTTGEDALYDQAVQVVIQDRKCSTSYIQRKLGIGYNKAARLVEQMEDEGIVTPANHVGKREILVPEQG
ncbi:MAG: DNA translocase FtsK 4TM domain-containing protein [Roseinatronobacter sp.]